MKAKHYILGAIVTLISLSSIAQESLTSVYYSIGLPIGSTKDFIQPASFRGAGISFESIVANNLSLGFNTGWQTFYEEFPKQSYERDGIAVTGFQYRYFNQIPLTITSKYFLKSYDSDVIIPYLGAAAGFHYIETRTDFGIYSHSKNGWPVALSPQAGVMIKTGPYGAFHLGAVWNNTFKSKKVDAQSWFSINVGLTFGGY